MLRTRVIPCLLLKGQGLVKTVRFKDAKYVGDPVNAVKIFNEKEVDELILLNITATLEQEKPPFKLIAKIASECFMPLCYGGGICSLEDIERILSCGVEKVCINSCAAASPSLIKSAAEWFGNQSIVVSVDAKRSLFGKYTVFSHCGKRNTNIEPVKYARKMEDLGAGEIFLNSIERDGTRCGYDIELIKKVVESVNIPVVASGGAGKIEDFGKAVKHAGASAVAAGSMFVFYGKYQAVLITYPDINELRNILD